MDGEKEAGKREDTSLSVSYGDELSISYFLRIRFPFSFCFKLPLLNEFLQPHPEEA